MHDILYNRTKIGIDVNRVININGTEPLQKIDSLSYLWILIDMFNY